MFCQTDSRYVPLMKNLYFLLPCFIFSTSAWSLPNDNRRSEMPKVDAVKTPMSLRATLQTTQTLGDKTQNPATQNTLQIRRLSDQERADLRSQLQLQRLEVRQSSP